VAAQASILGNIFIMEGRKMNKKVSESVAMVLIVLVFATACDGGSRITLAQYHALQDGMHYTEVVKILEREGVELSRSSMPAAPGQPGGYWTFTASWENRNGSNIQVIFLNDRLQSKAQAGLR
jgi:hypothetical protein